MEFFPSFILKMVTLWNFSLVYYIFICFFIFYHPKGRKKPLVHRVFFLINGDTMEFFPSFILKMVTLWNFSLLYYIFICFFIFQGPKGKTPRAPGFFSDTMEFFPSFILKIVTLWNFSLVYYILICFFHFLGSKRKKKPLLPRGFFLINGDTMKFFPSFILKMVTLQNFSLVYYIFICFFHFLVSKRKNPSCTGVFF